ncbi:tetratricopeptide repeat protein [Demequina activiva]|uniref:Co-chaperone YbbN n=1 Tax=Demequina activiva TaxID=1582364 RepID=A0A919Q505_9MICO|nr:tetratricopeptide repeat protein [Demequina activiva]GIG55292.1 co-chaperone YbbN [Demequina activiva]
MTSDNPDVPLRGSVDLSQLMGASQAPATTSAPASAGGGLPVPAVVTDQSLQELAQQSTQVPVIVVFLSSASPASKELVERMRAIVARYDGAFQLATCDIDVQGTVAQAFQVQAVPTVVALIAARPAPLFQGNAEQEQITGVLDQVLEIAQQNGVTGRVDGPTQPAGEPEPEPLPPLHQEAYDAIEREDYAAAIDAYDRALKENPKDADARAGRAQVALMERSRLADLDAVRRAAADAPDDVDAQLAVADLDVMGGQIEDAFGRLIDLVRRTFGDDRERIRLRLVELFEVVGPSDPRVAQARQALASALF